MFIPKTIFSSQAQFAEQVARAISSGGQQSDKSSSPSQEASDKSSAVSSKQETPVSSAAPSKESTPAPATQVGTGHFCRVLR